MGSAKGKRGGFLGTIERFGWIGTPLLIGALFFLIGALVSLLDGDMRPALQSLVVAVMLVAGSLMAYLRSGANS